MNATTSALLIAALCAPAISWAQDETAPVPVDRSKELRSARAVAQTWSTTYGAYVGATSGYLIGEALEETESAHIAQGIAPGLVVGAGIGGISGHLLTHNAHITVDEATWLWTGSGAGTFYGVQLSRAFIPLEADGATERIHAAGLAGSMAGVGVAMLTEAPSTRAQLHFDLATGIGSMAAAGVSDIAGLRLPDHRSPRAGINIAGAAALGGVSALYSTVAEEQPNAGAWGLSLAHAAWIGGMSPFLFTNEPTDLQVFGGVRAGLGIGYAGALLLASTGNPDGRSVALQTVGITAGNAIGAGIPLSVGVDPSSAGVVGPMLASGIAGQLLGAAVAPHYDLTPNDAYLLSTLGAWTAYQAGGWSAYAGATGQESTRAVGYALTTGGAGTLLAMGLAPALDVPASGSAMLLSSGGWGTWYGGWSAQLLDQGPEQGWLLMLSTGNIALLGTAVAEGAGWTPTWRDVGLIDGAGLLGAAGGGLLGVIALYDENNWDPMVGSILVGSTVGLGVGVALAARGAQASDLGTELPELRMGRTRWQPNVSARPWMSEDGDPGVWAELSLTEQR